MLSAVESQWLDFLVFDRAATALRRHAIRSPASSASSRRSRTAPTSSSSFSSPASCSEPLRPAVRPDGELGAGVLALLIAVIAMASLHGRRDGGVRADRRGSRHRPGARRWGVTHLVECRVPGRAVARCAWPRKRQSRVSPCRLRSASAGSACWCCDGRSAPADSSCRFSRAVVVGAGSSSPCSVYRIYRISLLANLRHRSLDPAALMIDGAEHMTAIERLVDSGDERDVRLGLDTLAGVDDHGLPAILQPLAVDERVGVRADVLSRLVSSIPTRQRCCASRALTPAPMCEPPVFACSDWPVSRPTTPISRVSGRCSAEVRLPRPAALSESGGNGVDRTRIHREASSRSPVVRPRLERSPHGCSASDGQRPSIDRTCCPPCSTMPITMSSTPHSRPFVGPSMSACSTTSSAISTIGRPPPRPWMRWREVATTHSTLADRGLRGTYRLGQYGNEQLARVCRVIGGPQASRGAAAPRRASRS